MVIFLTKIGQYLDKHVDFILFNTYLVMNAIMNPYLWMFIMLLFVATVVILVMMSMWL